MDTHPLGAGAMSGIRRVATHEEQLDAMERGEWTHVAVGDGEHECCPDFGCCSPELRWNAEQLRVFRAADSRLREQILVMSIGALVALRAPDKVVHIAGQADEEVPPS